RFAGHAEVPGVELRPDVLARLPAEGEFEIVDGGRAVHRDGSDDAAANQVDEVRSAAGLDDVPADGDSNTLPGAVGADHMVANVAELVRSELFRQRVEEVRKRRGGCDRAAEVGHGYLARPRVQFVGAEPAQVEWSHPCVSVSVAGAIRRSAAS